MKILLIGNGFDLEHGLPTAYRDFLEFCKRVNVIYTARVKVTPGVYKREYLDSWETAPYIKKVLFEAFRGRSCKETRAIFTFVEASTKNALLNEMYTYIDKNTWLEYFLEQCSGIGENWIDFEAEISRVIQALDHVRARVEGGEPVSYTELNSKMLSRIWNLSGRSIEEPFSNIQDIDKFAGYLNAELEKLIRALEIYIAEFVHRIEIEKKSADIEKLNPDCVLSFNYSDTYERVYDPEKKVDYDYIHGKADTGNNLETCSLVLGIDEYLDDGRKDRELAFLSFKKYYQRIYKGTGNEYLEWIEMIKNSYEDYCSQLDRQIEDQILQQRKRTLSAKAQVPIISAPAYPEHTLYIFGHSLDVTDRDVLRMLICNDNVKTVIFYHRRNKNDKTQLGKLIKNLILLIGQDELIRRTGGERRTIEFVPQELHEN